MVHRCRRYRESITRISNSSVEPSVPDTVPHGLNPNSTRLALDSAETLVEPPENAITESTSPVISADEVVVE
jgi:hypothetical protein